MPAGHKPWKVPATLPCVYHNRELMTSPTLSFDLNPEQLEAVEHNYGPILVFAGAGSGKTRVITCRIARLLQSRVPPHRILAVTFTNKAAREMRERIEKMAGGSAHGMWMGTFHSICARMLRIDAKSIGIDPTFTIYDDDDQMSLIREILKAKNIDDKAVNPRTILGEISTAKEKMFTPEQFSRQAAGFIEQIAGDVYKAYATQLRKCNALDFDDLLFMTVKMLEESEAVREKYQDRFLQVMVDEYQDVNYAQYQFVKLMSGKHRNVMVVGDDDQSIYAWRGADVKLILSFASDYPDAKVVKLERNYRSTKTILAAANEVIKKNRGRAQKQLWTENAQGVPIKLLEAGTEHDEAMMVASAIENDVRVGRRKYSDFAVLYRMNAQSRVLEEAFLTLRIPHILVGGQRFYQRKEIKDVLAYLRLALNPMDDVSFRRVINVPTRGIGDSSLGIIQNFAVAQGVSLYEAIGWQDVQNAIPKKTLSGVMKFRGVIEEARDMAEAGPITPVLKHLLTASGYVEALRQEHSQEAVNRLDNLQEMVNVVAEYDSTTEEPSLAGFLESVALVADIDTADMGSEAVTLMTLHAAKGLEFPVVYLVGMEEGLFPHSRSLNSESEMEEERRLAYVGMTRAQQELNVLHAQRRAIYGQPNFTRPSRFLQEIPPELIVYGDGRSAAEGPARRVEQERSGSYRVVERPVGSGSPLGSSGRNLRGPEWKAPFEVGNKVRHGKFGIGVVIACAPIQGDSEVTVAFPGVVGVKKLVQGLAKLEKVD